ncbi:hypothetical protein Q428_10895 [Fervidicella metallireducens AeB]|uniref:Uncharacterized protein n=1 Tax=Fervidicella metallireducens AeB TaxID=1403537 RepID=A0A017RTE4_9CLOT|nr:hypothetical protein [Fervidicella metallireducens]EYE87881.1 hypothetical protein Q428_10895 [Fervidicella metallireducens AeB]
MKTKGIVLTLLILSLVLILIYSKKPFIESRDWSFDNALTINNKGLNKVFGEIKNKKDVDFVKFKGSKGDEFFIQMLIPQIKMNKGFTPNLVLMGEGIYHKDLLPFEVKKNYGVINIEPGPMEKVYDNYTQTYYYRAQSIRGELPKDGEYYIGLFSKNNGGKYLLLLGEKNRFNPFNLIIYPFIYLRIKYFFNPLQTLMSIIFIFLIILTIVKRNYVKQVIYNKLSK